MLQKLRRFGYASVALQGLLSAVAPKAGVAVTKRLLGLHFEGADDLEARPWYVRQTRAVGLGMVAMGLAGLLLEDRDEPPADDPTPSTDDD
ncbi:hypothetical protein [Salinirubrum litoreum]|uniref:DUF6199 domain-containing protein n=1 Tax=Salinirubrum litoreum TaxID=1126234 RepID=A0ABD5RDU7_9EURY|nr:hypothetical protein [Salinirubrum litoreum]